VVLEGVAPDDDEGVTAFVVAADDDEGATAFVVAADDADVTAFDVVLPHPAASHAATAQSPASRTPDRLRPAPGCTLAPPDATRCRTAQIYASQSRDAIGCGARADQVAISAVSDMAGGRGELHVAIGPVMDESARGLS
jgi:hypothetical protein